jgi:transcriptional regulator NrdR family protein
MKNPNIACPDCGFKGYKVEKTNNPDKVPQDADYNYRQCKCLRCDFKFCTYETINSPQIQYVTGYPH